MNDDKIFFQPGDIVVLRHKDVKNKPVMYITEKVSKQYKAGDEINSVLTGMRCRWFDENKVLREAIFSTKDLEFYK